MTHFAWLETTSYRFLAQYEQSSPYIPFSAVTELLQGIWQQHSVSALRTVRSRIFTTEAYSDLSWGMVRIAGKRISFDSILPIGMLDDPATVHVGYQSGIQTIGADENTSAIRYPTQESREIWLRKQCDRLISEADMQGNPSLGKRDRQVIAALFERSTGRLISCSPNHNATNRTLHAEVLLLQNWWEKEQRGIPEGYELWVSREPCTMCAAMIATLWADMKKDSLHFLEKEMGPAAGSSVLRARRVGICHS